MDIIVNGEKHTVPDRCTISQLLGDLNVSGRLAVEVNEEIVPRSQFDTYSLRRDDRIEIVHAIGGG
ncbi:MAG: sulfur carrier protein ThiS [Gammaproteobacteria bacterium]|nr:sulfur carrier protein ThiS [Gammaproteobacteria bacterium]MCI0591057.1 sulfur carrier protein ThiS [Gammaproteobacteria bacterium]